MNGKLIPVLSMVVLVGVVGYAYITLQPAPTIPSQPVQVQITQQQTDQTGVTTSAATTYTLADISAHNTALSCWSAINGKAYDLTSWINQHPGGSQAILSICGIDGSAAFNAQHGGQSRPEQELASFYIGDLKP